MSPSYQPDDYKVDNEDEEYLTRVVVDTCARKFFMYSNQGDTREIQCDSVDAGGLAKVAGFTINVVDPASVGIDETDLFYNINIYPNPAKDNVKIDKYLSVNNSAFSRPTKTLA